MDVDRENIVGEATTFQAEGEELLADPMVSLYVVEQIVNQGAAIAVVFGEETERRTNATADKARETERAIHAKSRPITINRLEQEHRELTAEYQAYYGPFMEFLDFMERARAAYYQHAGMEDPDPVETAITTAMLAAQQGERALQEKEAAAKPEDVDRGDADNAAAAVVDNPSIKEADLEEMKKPDPRPSGWRRLFNF